jgi:hypothetical protein
MAEQIENGAEAARTRARRVATVTGRAVVTVLALLVALFTVLAARSFAGRSSSTGSSAAKNLHPASFVASARTQIAQARAASSQASSTPVTDPTPPAPPTQSAAPQGTSSAGNTTIS